MGSIRYLGLSSNIMSLGGIAIAVGELADAAIELIENAHWGVKPVECSDVIGFVKTRN